MKTKFLSLFTVSFVAITLLFGFSKSKNSRNNDFVKIPYKTPFWMLNREVNNADYQLFINDLKNKGKTNQLAIAQVQNDKWLSESDPDNAPFAKYYSSHPTYANYPVVNVTYEAAQLYCEWLTQKENNPNISYRLPTKEEWIFAAKGGNAEAIYSCESNTLINKRGKSNCNFYRLSDEWVSKSDNGTLEIKAKKANEIQNTSIPFPVDIYKSNAYGLYNCSGNVAEMISTKGIAMGGSYLSSGFDVRIESESSYSEANPTLGFRIVKVMNQ